MEAMEAVKAVIRRRLDTYSASPDAMQAMMALEVALARLDLAPTLVQLVKLRASQLNHCAFCVDTESAEALRMGECARRLSALPVWRGSPLFSDAERAAFAWTEALTVLTPDASGMALQAQLQANFSDRQIADLAFAIVTINAWNRLGVGFRALPAL